MTIKQYPEVDECVLWIKKSSEQGTFLSGIIKIGSKEYRVVSFRNKFKRDDRSPDFVFRKKRASQDSIFDSQNPSAG